MANWQARLRLGFQQRHDKTVLVERERCGPLAVQRPFYPEADVCHTYILHPPGGVAGGDQLEIDVSVGDKGSALLTTPGATKFYRSAGDIARQTQRLSVTAGDLEWLPQENIFFPGADVCLSTHVNLHADARFIGWEINCLGRPVIAERFTPGRAIFHFHLYRNGLPLLRERFPVMGTEALDGAASLRGQPVFASLYATPANHDLLTAARAVLPAQQTNCAITCVDEILIARYLGDSTETARRLFVKIWMAIRPVLLQREPCPPRIWQT